MRIKAGLLLAIALLAIKSEAGAQESGRFLLGTGGGVTLYCIDTRCDAGTILGLSSGIQFTPAVAAEVGGRWHRCFDCDQFLIADAAVLVQYPRARIRPYAGGGVAYSTDPGFMGDHVGLMAAVGAQAPVAAQWLLRADVRGRRVSGAGEMGEFTLWIYYRP